MKILYFHAISFSFLLMPRVSLAITNPLNEKFNTFPKFLEGIIDVIIQIAVPIIVLLVIYAGYLFVTAQGKPEALNKAKMTLFWTLVGALIILGAQVISKVVQGTIDDIT